MPATVPPRLGAFGILLIGTLLYSWTLLTEPGLPRGDDISAALQWARSFTESLQEGHLYPRWVSYANRGYGAPVFSFYPPLPYYATALASLFTDNVIGALRLALISSIFLSGLSFYFAARPRSAEWGAAIGAVLYMLLPYHVFDLHVRFAFAELWAFVWVPLVFRFAGDLAEQPGWPAWYGLALCSAGLVLTHPLTAYMAILVVGPYLLIQLRGWSPVLAIGTAGTVALLISAIYVIPMIVERGWVNSGFHTTVDYGRWERNFVYMDESALGSVRTPVRTAIARSVWPSLLVAMVSALLLLLRKDENRKEIWLYAGLSLWVFFLQIPLSSFVWSTVPELDAVQFPWRFSLLQVFLASLLVARVFRRWSMHCLVVAAVAVPAFVVSVGLTQQRGYLGTPAFAAEEHRLYRWFFEYIPAGLGDFLDQKSRSSAKFSRVPPQFHISGRGRVEVVSWTSHGRKLQVRADEPVTIRLRTFAYPGWVAHADEHPLELRQSTHFGAAEFDLSEGKHSVELSFEGTPDQQIGALISGVAVLGLIGLSGGLWYSRTGRPTSRSSRG